MPSSGHRAAHFATSPYQSVPLTDCWGSSILTSVLWWIHNIRSPYHTNVSPSHQHIHTLRICYGALLKLGCSSAKTDIENSCQSDDQHLNFSSIMVVSVMELKSLTDGWSAQEKLQWISGGMRPGSEVWSRHRSAQWESRGMIFEDILPMSCHVTYANKICPNQ